jgi:hypothetical protein
MHVVELMCRLWYMCSEMNSMARRVGMVEYIETASAVKR